jgi:hypothetical protein
MKALAATFVCIFVLWVVDVNLNGSRYTEVVAQVFRTTVASFTR